MADWTYTPAPGGFGESEPKIRRTESGTLARIAKLHFPREWYEPSDGTRGIVCGGPCEWAEWPCLTQRIIEGEA